MQDKAPVLGAHRGKTRTRPQPLEDVAAWKFGDFLFSAEWDVISDCGKARRAGFCETVDSEEMFLRLFAELRVNRIIP